MHRLVVPLPEVDAVGLRGANLLTPLVRQNRLLVTKVIMAAGPLRDGLTPNTGILWIGRYDSGIDAMQPLFPNDSLELDTQDLGGLLDLATLYVLGANATDVLRLIFWPASDEMLAATQPGGSE